MHIGQMAGVGRCPRFLVDRIIQQTRLMVILDKQRHFLGYGRGVTERARILSVGTTKTTMTPKEQRRLPVEMTVTIS